MSNSLHFNRTESFVSSALDGKHDCRGSTDLFSGEVSLAGGVSSRAGGLSFELEFFDELPDDWLPLSAIKRHTMKQFIIIKKLLPWKCYALDNRKHNLVQIYHFYFSKHGRNISITTHSL